jgi:hypothetical protein
MRLPLSSIDITAGRKRRAFLSTVAVISAGALSVAACGGSGSTAAPKATTTTTVESPETRAWVAAATRGIEATAGMHVSAADAACLGRAFVENVTVQRFKAAGVTKATLEDPNADTPPRLGALVPDATRKALGASLEACGGGVFGDVVAQGLAQGAGKAGYQLDAASRACVRHWFSSPASQTLIASFVLDRNPTVAHASQLADLTVTCLDVATMLAPSMHITFVNSERVCVNRLARTSPLFRSVMRSEFAGSANSSTTHDAQLFGATIVKCLTPEHLLQLGRNAIRSGMLAPHTTA